MSIRAIESIHNAVDGSAQEYAEFIYRHLQVFEVKKG